MKTINLVPFILISVLFNCQQRNSTSDKLTNDTSDTPEAYQAYLHNLYEDRLAEELNVERLKIGVDSFELRFYTKTVFRFGLQQMIVLKNKNNSWSCLEYQYIMHQVPFGSDDIEYATKFTIDTIRILKRQPASGWDNFIAALEQEHIYDLPSQFDIPAWDSMNVVIADGTTYSVEFADRERYRYYSYNTPQEFAKYVKECKNMQNIIEIMNREIGVLDELDEIIKTHDEIKTGRHQN